MISKKALEILNYIKENSKEDNLEIRLNYSKLAYAKGEPFSSGYFDQPDEKQNIKYPLLVVGIDKEESQWIEVLLHEYNHFLQWKNQTPAWKEYIDLYKDYNEGDEESFEQLETTVNMESECESNTIKLAKELNYDINPSRYIQKVNAYLVFYQIYAEKKEWYKSAPFEDNDILKLMPSDKIIKKPMRYEINSELYSYYLKHLII